MRKSAFSLALASAMVLPAASFATTSTDPSGYVPTGPGPNFGSQTPVTLSVTATQELVCGLTLGTKSLTFGPSDFNAYSGYISVPAQTKNVAGTVACNNKNQSVTVTAYDSSGTSTGGNSSNGFETMSTTANADDPTALVMNWNLDSTGPSETLTTSTQAATNIYDQDFTLHVSVLPHSGTEAVYAGTYTGSIIVAVAPST